MSLDNLPLFNAMNREEVKPPFPHPHRPLTSQESHFAIMEKVNACIHEVNQFEHRIKHELDEFMDKMGTENFAFKEAIQSSYNAFQEVVQREINNFELGMQNNFDIYRNDIDKRVADFQTAINNEFEVLQTNVLKASNDKIAEMEKLKIDLNKMFNNYKATVNEIINNFKTQVNHHMEEQDAKIEAYKQYMVDNLPANVKAVFEQKANNGEIAEIMAEVYGGTRTFKGSLSYDEIQAITNASNGDYYFCTTDEHYYQRTDAAWVDIGNGEKIVDDYEAFKLITNKTLINDEALTDEIYVKMFANSYIPDSCFLTPELTDAYILDINGKALQTVNNETDYHITEKIPVTPNEIIFVNCTWNNKYMGYAFYDSEDNVVAKRGSENGYIIKPNPNVMQRALKNFPVVVPENASYIRLQGNRTRLYANIGRNCSLFFKDYETNLYINNLLKIIGNGNLIIGEDISLNLMYNKVFNLSGIVETANQNNVFVITDYTEIEEGGIYYISCGSQSEFYAYGFYNKDYKFISGLQAIQTEETDDIGTTIFKNIVIAPYGAKYIMLAGNITREEIFLKKVVSLNTVNALPWAGKKWVAYGDSITEFNYRAEKNYHDFIAEETGITVLNYGISGSGYARSDNAFHLRIGQLENVDFDVITFFGSGNDLNSGLELGTANDTGTETVGGCINTTLDNLLSIKPLAKIGIITPNPWKNNTPADNGTMETYCEMLVEIAKHRSIPVLDLFHCSTLNPNSPEHNKAFYSCDQAPDGDGVHPNADGHSRLAPLIREFLKTLI